MKPILIATHNMGKYDEIEDFFQSVSPQPSLVHMKSLGLPSPDETGLTFIENALIKARFAAQASGLPTIADDSGLVVETLSGQPGVKSARFAGEQANNSDNIQKLLMLLRASEHTLHPAHYHCSLVFLRHPEDPDPIVAQARWHGQMVLEPQGDQGFGYDPIFYDPTLGCTAAQLSLADKNKMSHRGRALQLLIQSLQTPGGFHGEHSA